MAKLSHKVFHQCITWAVRASSSRSSFRPTVARRPCSPISSSSRRGPANRRGLLVATTYPGSLSKLSEPDKPSAWYEVALGCVGETCCKVGAQTVLVQTPSVAKAIEVPAVARQIKSMAAGVRSAGLKALTRPSQWPYRTPVGARTPREAEQPSLARACAQTPAAERPRPSASRPVAAVPSLRPSSAQIAVTTGIVRPTTGTASPLKETAVLAGTGSGVGQGGKSRVAVLQVADQTGPSAPARVKDEVAAAKTATRASPARGAVARAEPWPGNGKVLAVP